jgi:hypothetical protein
MLQRHKSASSLATDFFTRSKSPTTRIFYAQDAKLALDFLTAVDARFANQNSDARKIDIRFW